jgi:hypothetical protein
MKRRLLYIIAGLIVGICVGNKLTIPIISKYFGYNAKSFYGRAARLRGKCIYCEKSHTNYGVDRKYIQQLLGPHNCIEERLHRLETK